MKRRTLQLAALTLLVLVTGVFWGTWFALTRSIEDFSASEFIHIGKVIIGNVGPIMPILFPACIVLMILTLWRYPRQNNVGFYSGIAAVVLILVTLAITVGIEVPIDNQIKIWTADTVPSDWEAIRARWAFYHTARTGTSVFSAVFFSMSLCIRDAKGDSLISAK